MPTTEPCRYEGLLGGSGSACKGTVAHLSLIEGSRPVGSALSNLESGVALQLREDDFLQEMPAAGENPNIA